MGKVKKGSCLTDKRDKMQLSIQEGIHMRIQPNAKSQDVLKGMRSNVSAGAGETRMLSGTKKQKQTEEKNRKNGRLFVGNLQKNLQNKYPKI